jgi:two-component system, NarL family, sensor histidine kinase DesK
VVGEGPVNCHNDRVEQPVSHATPLAGLRRYTWWTVPGATAFILVVCFADWLVDPDVPAWARWTCAVALAATAAVIVVLLSRRLALLPGAATANRPTAWLVAGSAGAAVLGGIPLGLENYGLWAVAPAMMAAILAAFAPARRRMIVVAGATLLAAVPGAVVSTAHGGDEVIYAAAFPPGLFLFTAWVMLGPLWAWDIAGRLNDARLMSAELAVQDERLRFAADLHDIQGHHLQVIALKSELAARLAEVDAARAAAEMKQVQQLSIAALQETRGLVQGYRRTTLEDEISNATRVLAAADIDATMSAQPVGHLSPAGRHLLGLVVREATTNVLRHSHAAHADVDYHVDERRARLSISNDGAVHRPDAPPGTGLATLAERLRSAGGDLTWRLDGDRFVVEATLPLPAGRETR